MEKRGKMKKFLALVICFMFVGVAGVSAQTETGALLKKRTFELAHEISYRIYREPGVMKEKGMMYGLAGSYTYHNKIMLKAEGRGSWGEVDYSNSGKIDNITDYMLEFRGLGGYDFSIVKTFILTPFIGIGYRYLNDDSSGKTSTTGARGYERESNYLYSPIGIGFITGLGKNWSLGGRGEYDLFWWGEQKSHLSDASAGYNDLENCQRKGYGFRGSVTLERKFKKVIFQVGHFIRHWKIKKSETETVTYYGTPIGVGWEPRNNSTEIGIMLGVKF
jgi:hypothetical protein